MTLKHSRPNRQLKRSATAKVTQDEYESLLEAAHRRGQNLSGYIRDLLLVSLRLNPEVRLQMQFSAIGEERIRLIFEAAQKGQKLGSRESLQQVEQEATIAAVELTENRISVLEQLSVTTCGNANNNAK